MLIPKFLRWQGVGKLYALPWMKNRIQYLATPSLIRAFAKTKFTRSRLLMSLLTHFHLSKESALVSDDDHARYIISKMGEHFPSLDAYPDIAKELITNVFIRLDRTGKGEAHLASPLIRELYVIQLKVILGVKITHPLQEFIDATVFQPGSSSLHLEGVLFSLGVHKPIMAPIRVLLWLTIFRDKRTMRSSAKRLERAVFFLSSPLPGSWYSYLEHLKCTGKITRAQFNGELTAFLVSSFSLASVLCSAILCLAELPDYVARIRGEPTFAKFFMLEVLRLYPPFRQFGYESIDKEEKSLHSKKSSDFIISAYLLHRDPTYWANAETFFPERFMEPGQRGDFKYLPFGMGKRVCPGRQFSLCLLTEAVKFLCSAASGVTLKASGALPVGHSGRVVSFAIDDKLAYQLNSRAT